MTQIDAIVALIYFVFQRPTQQSPHICKAETSASVLLVLSKRQSMQSKALCRIQEQSAYFNSNFTTFCDLLVRRRSMKKIVDV